MSLHIIHVCPECGNKSRFDWPTLLLGAQPMNDSKRKAGPDLVASLKAELRRTGVAWRTVQRMYGLYAGFCVEDLTEQAATTLLNWLKPKPSVEAAATTEKATS